MKLSFKIFLCFVILFGITFQAAGYLLINFAYQNAIGQEKKMAVQEFQHNKYILQSILYLEPTLLTEGGKGLERYAKSFTVPVAFYGEEKECLFSNMTVPPEQAVLEGLEWGRISFQITQYKTGSYIFVGDSVPWDTISKTAREEETLAYDGTAVYLLTETDISSVVASQREMIAYFQRIYLLILGIGVPVIFLLTSYLTRTIKRVGKAARRIAEGRYSERIQVSGRDEIGEMAADFNQMAARIEEKMAELSDTARQKEDFTANFAHELKTPLTSVIGYADMIYQKELPREQVKSAAEYIWKEGMRLEALSQKLMDLFVLNKQDFLLQDIALKQPALQETLEDLQQGMEPLCKKYGVSFHMELEEGTIAVDYDLFKTMLLNLVDNAAKADSKDIWLTGRNLAGTAEYELLLRDNGKGIPPGELGRITEAFYMVDKSRARKQHGAGLGMALVAKIAELHGAELNIESDGLHGTMVSLLFHHTASGQKTDDQREEEKEG